MKKLLTAKKLLPCIHTEGWYVIKKDDGTFTFHDTTNTIDPVVEERYKHLVDRVQFDETLYLEAFEKFKTDREVQRQNFIKEREEAEELARQKEKERLRKLEEDILQCETPSELADKFGFKMIETASHWSDLYESRSHYAVLLIDRQDYEVMEMAVKLLDIEGEFGECCNRAGEHHHTFSRGYDLEEYQKSCKRHFNGDHYFYKNPETEAEFVLECIKNEAVTLDDVRGYLKDYDEMETGYYFCNGGLAILEETLEDPDFTGYSEDVYRYQFAFQFQFKNKFNSKEDDDTEDED
jgi:hypothetical protein